MSVSLTHNDEPSSPLIPFFVLLAFTLTFIANVSNMALSIATAYLLIILGIAKHQSRPLFHVVANNYSYAAFLSFFLWALFSIFWSTDISISSYKVIEFSLCLLGIFVGGLMTDKEFNKVLKIFIIFALLMCVISAYQVFVLKFGRPVGLFFDRNTNGSYLVVGLLSLSAFYVFEPKYYSSITGAGISLFVYAIGLSQSRGAVLSLIIALLLFFSMIVRENRYRGRFGLLLLWGLAGFILENITSTGSVLRFIDTLQSGDVSSTRFSLWRSAYELYLEEPLLGHGLGALWGSFVVSRFDIDLVPPYAPHNDYLQLLAELGPIGLLLFVLFVFLILRQYSTIKRSETGLWRNGNVVAAWLALVAVFVHIFFNFHFYSVKFLLIVGILSGYLGRVTVGAGDGDKYSYVWPIPVIIRYISLLVFLFVFGLHITLFISERLLNVAEGLGELEQAERYYQLASAVAPYRAKPHIRMGERIMQNVSLQKSISNIEKRLLINEAMKQFAAAKSVSQYNYSVYSDSAELMSRYPSLYSSAEIVDNYEMALKLKPNSLDAYLSYSNYLRTIGTSYAAWQVLEKAWGRWFYNTGEQLLIDYCESLTALRQKHATSADIQAVRSFQTQLLRTGQAERAKWGVWLR